MRYILTLFIIFALSPDLYALTAGKVNKGNRLFKDEKFKEAQKLYEEAAKESSDPRIKYDMANVKAKQKEYEKALDYYNQVLGGKASDELKQKTHYNMGNLYHDKGDISKAAKEWKEALIMDPEDSDARHNLALALKELKKNQQKKKNKKNEKDKDEKNKKDRQKEKEKSKKEKEETKRILKMLEEKEKKARKKLKEKQKNLNVEKDW